jgi:hypothetical protein
MAVFVLFCWQSLNPLRYQFTAISCSVVQVLLRLNCTRFFLGGTIDELKNGESNSE